MAQHPDAAKQRRWLALVRMWLSSRLSIREFCRRHRLSAPSFYAWRRTLDRRGLLQAQAEAQRRPAPAAPSPSQPPLTFVQLTASPPEPEPLPAPADAAALELVLDQRLTLRVRPGFDPDTLQRLLRLLQQESPC